jgi:uncharacterized delta-60 repeat protein
MYKLHPPQNIIRITTLALAVLAVSAGVALAATAGDLDPSFDGDGKLVLPLGFDPKNVIAQPDGKVLVTDSQKFQVLRLNADGSLDKSFGGDGVAGTSFAGGGTVTAAALQPDGKILVAGLTGSLIVAVARFDSRGALDPTFDPGGPDGDGKRVYSDGINLWHAGAILIQGDGRIVLAGHSNAGITAARLTATGAPDGTWYDLAHDFTDAEAGSAAAFAPDGSLVIAGYSQTGQNPDQDLMLVHFKTDGTLDESLGGTGYVKLGPDGENESPTAVFVRPDDKIVVVEDSGPGEPKTRVVRLNPDGTPDKEFGDGGYAAPDFDGDDSSAGAAMQPDGKILVAATSTPEYTFGVARLDATGQLDQSFGVGGKSKIAFDDIARATAAGLQPDGRFVVAGVTLAPNRLELRTGVARVLADQPPGGEGQGAGDPPPPAPRCAGKPATIVGTAGRDRLRGTRRADVIVALGGNDRVIGRGGNDVVCGGRGRDLLSGGRGRDRLSGGPQRDTCIGGAARDRASSCEIRRSL